MLPSVNQPFIEYQTRGAPHVNHFSWKLNKLGLSSFLIPSTFTPTSSTRSPLPLTLVFALAVAALSSTVTNFQILSPYSHLLSFLSVNPEHVKFPFACGIPELDAQNIMIIMIDVNGILLDENGEVRVAICQSCHTALKMSHNDIPPSRALANHRWIGSVPEELQGLTWLEESFISRSHQIQKIVQLGRRDSSAYFALKGHAILLPQNTTPFLHLLPPSPSIHSVAANA